MFSKCVSLSSLVKVCVNTYVKVRVCMSECVLVCVYLCVCFHKGVLQAISCRPASSAPIPRPDKTRPSTYPRDTDNIL